ncbi:MAG: hypothetical protein IBX64_12905 [Actinobacteria bacterium]|nr:hypothetical protein [Actinomycetota bacterium]
MPAMSANNLIEADQIVDALRQSIYRTDGGLNNVPGLLKRLLKEEGWKKRIIERTGEIVEFDSFSKFVTTPPLEGLGAEINLVKRIISNDKEALDLLDRALQNPHGKHCDVNNVNVRPQGNSEKTALRRLRKDKPELHKEVLEGNLSAHAAMVKAGFRLKTVSVPIGRPDSIASTLRKHMSVRDLERLAHLLLGDQDAT